MKDWAAWTGDVLIGAATPSATWGYDHGIQPLQNHGIRGPQILLPGHRLRHYGKLHARSDNAMGGELPLSSLSISGFRGFQNLVIPQLGRVTLLTGRNGVGKTTVLDAMRIYAAATRDTPWPLADLLEQRLRQQDEWRDGLDKDKGNPVRGQSIKAAWQGTARRGPPAWTT